MNCAICETKLTGRQTRFCSRPCSSIAANKTRVANGKTRKASMNPESYANKLEANKRWNHTTTLRTIKTCPVCHETVVRKYRGKENYATCSARCGREYAIANKTTEMVRVRPLRLWIPIVARGTARFTSGQCRVCATHFTSQHMDITCSDKCRRRWKNSTSKPNLKRWITSADRYAIYERDNWTCQLCTKPIDRTIQWEVDNYQPMIASLDHIVPRSHGGTHEPNNLRAVHHICNSIRGNKVELQPH